jgi:2-polyprenyl-3-methyl-5-hydroxy-6-metoxy-1,4-benzoquinol methylase
MSLFPDFKRRDRVPELMDEPGLSGAEHVHALSGLARINLISRTANILWHAIRPLAERHNAARLRVLDVACGGGDVAIALHTKSVRRQTPIDVAGCDIRSTAVRHAASRAATVGADVTFFEHDILDAHPEGFDVVCCNLFLHHLNEAQAVSLLSSMRRSARRMVLISDLIRSRAGYALAWWGVRLLTRSQIVHTDGPLSVRASFTPQEALALARRSGMTSATLTQHWPRRFLLKWRAP